MKSSIQGSYASENQEIKEVKKWRGKIMNMICKDAQGVHTANGYPGGACAIPISS
jgi:hypothetical protein